MSVIALQQQPQMSVGDTETFGIDYTGWLDSGELLTGTPTVVEVISTDLTISNKVISTVLLTILDESDVAIGAAVQFVVSGQLTGITYTVRVTIGTDATPARTIVRDVVFHVA